MNKVYDRVRAVANGATINGTYKDMPIAAHELFKADLRKITEVPLSDAEWDLIERALRAYTPPRQLVGRLTVPGNKAAVDELADRIRVRGI